MNLPSALNRAIKVLSENKYFVLAINDDNGPWASALAHTLGSPNCLFFFSSKSSRHGTAMSKRCKIAGVLYDSTCSVEDVESIQFSGEGKMAHTRDNVEFVLRLSAKRDRDQEPSDEEIDIAFNKSETLLYRVDVQEAYVLNQELFGKEGVDGREPFDVLSAFQKVLQ